MCDRQVGSVGLLKEQGHHGPAPIHSRIPGQNDPRHISRSIHMTRHAPGPRESPRARQIAMDPFHDRSVLRADSHVPFTRPLIALISRTQRRRSPCSMLMISAWDQ